MMTDRRRLRTARNIRKFTRSIFTWYRRNGRELPWRTTRDPYRILLSEVMLQQTQVSRVVTKYRSFLRRFPSLRRLARARLGEVIRVWDGMGYNNRAVRLWNLARTVVSQYGGRLPRDPEVLRKLPGIGRYTSHAVACFAWNRQVPVVEVNIERVLGRFFPAGIRKPDTWQLAASILPPRCASTWNQALMDFGAAICAPRAPLCGECPLANLCPSAFSVLPKRRQPAKPEPSRNGIPNRIFRGRIVRVLRSTPPKSSIPLARLGRSIKPDFGKRDRKWLTVLLHGLERDGLVKLRTRGESRYAALAE